MLKGYKQFDIIERWNDLILLLKVRFASGVVKPLVARKTTSVYGGRKLNTVLVGASAKNNINSKLNYIKTRLNTLGGKAIRWVTLESMIGLPSTSDNLYVVKFVDWQMKNGNIIGRTLVPLIGGI